MGMSLLLSSVCPCCCAKPEKYTLTRRESHEAILQFNLDDAFELESDLEDEAGVACRAY